MSVDETTPAAPNDTPLPATTPEKGARVRIPDLLRGPFDVRSLALSGLFLLAVFYTMYFMRTMLLPLVLALLLSYLLAPVVRAFGRVRIGPAFAAAIVLLSLLGIVGYSASFLAQPATSWLQKAPYSLHRLQEKLSAVRGPMQKVEQANGELEKITGSDDPKTHTVVVKHSRLSETLVAQTPDLIAGAAVLLILLYFLLAYDGVFLGKLIKVTPRLADKKRAVSIAHEIAEQISRYLLTVTAINVGLGTAVGLTVGLLGLPNPIMWGALVATLNFVPYLGALTGIVCMALAAVLSFDGFGWAMVFPGSYLVLATLEGNFITPWLLGKSLTLNPVIILLSITFWGWMWGIAGMILAVPILATFKIFCDHIKPMEPVAEFLS